MMNGSSRIWALGLLLGVLVVGGTAGAAADRFVFKDAACEDSRRRGEGGYVGWLADELELTADQRSEVERVVDRHRERMSAVWHEVRPQFEQMKGELREEIAATLTPEQETRYQQLLERHRRHDGRRMKRK